MKKGKRVKHKEPLDPLWQYRKRFTAHSSILTKIRCGCANLSWIPPAVLEFGQAQKGGEITSSMKKHLNEECEDAAAKAYLLPVVLEFGLVQQGRKVDTYNEPFDPLDPFSSNREKRF
jgi:hypothetical protein